MENLGESIPVVLYILGFLLALAVSIAWIILPFVLMSKLNQIVKSLGIIEMVSVKFDRERAKENQG